MVSAQFPFPWSYARQNNDSQLRVDRSVRSQPDRTSVSESGLDDSELVQRSLKGDRHSFRLLYRRYHDRVRSTLYQLCGSSQLDDLVQEVFLRAWKGLPKFQKRSQFSTWLYRISCNVASDRRRKLAKQAPATAEVETNLAAGDRSELMELHYRDLVQRGLESLSWEHRAVLVLHDLEDLPQKEVAQILQVPVGTVKSRLFNGRAAMRKFLEAEGVQL
ncbi:sigma-70 family RNA polymerase sigma factor [Roseofilum sp. BLCC_M143]|uniref:Sigma-70 family RNA polymerase sigma factor n=1 Tax=Roseofilum casamattae BLCC-M143 TaxID=3022442 RepID=A0ABT7BW37_9CYAN|nr:sigma-70 family RNA polymerase sigma factor [Roseofilum casamattae]MDJ1183405.1 sigma-70 family RNA polymerase sigma factor [Roseofilum casamattae BLCC-M143]